MSNLELIERAIDAIVAVMESNAPTEHASLNTVLWTLNSLKRASLKRAELSKGLEEITPFEAMCIAKGSYIEAINSVRARTPLGLRESKDIIDNARKIWEKL